MLITIDFCPAMLFDTVISALDFAFAGAQTNRKNEKDKEIGVKRGCDDN